MNYFLIGFKNSGKTSLGKAAASFLNRRFLDTDQLLENLLKESSFNIYRKLGEKDFRNVESALLKSLQGVTQAVIATGGGSVVLEENQNILSSLGKIIYLKTPQQLLIERWKAGKKCFISSEEQLKNLLLSRKEIYQKVADTNVEICHDFDKSLKRLINCISNG